MAAPSYTARLSADQTTNLAIGNHWELDLDDNPAVASVSTGAGQANGLVTVNRTGLYIVEFSWRITINESSYEAVLRSHPSNADLLDVAGQNLAILANDDSNTTVTEITGQSSIFSLTAGDVIKVDFRAGANLVAVNHEFTQLTLVAVD